MHVSDYSSRTTTICSWREGAMGGSCVSNADAQNGSFSTVWVGLASADPTSLSKWLEAGGTWPKRPRIQRPMYISRI